MKEVEGEGVNETDRRRRCCEEPSLLDFAAAGTAAAARCDPETKKVPATQADYAGVAAGAGELLPAAPPSPPAPFAPRPPLPPLFPPPRPQSPFDLPRPAPGPFAGAGVCAPPPDGLAPSAPPALAPPRPAPPRGPRPERPRRLLPLRWPVCAPEGSTPLLPSPPAVGVEGEAGTASASPGAGTAGAASLLAEPFEGAAESGAAAAAVESDFFACAGATGVPDASATEAAVGVPCCCCCGAALRGPRPCCCCCC